MSFEEIEVYHEHSVRSTRQDMAEPTGENYSPTENSYQKEENHVEEKTLSPEEVKEYQLKAQKGLMWLSAKMKMYFRDFLDPNNFEFPDQWRNVAPEKRAIVAELFDTTNKYFEYLDKFLTAFNLPTYDAVEQENTVATLEKMFSEIMASDEVYFSVYQNLESTDLMNLEEFTSLAREFRHDINTAGFGEMGFESERVKMSPFSQQREHISTIYADLHDQATTDRQVGMQIDIERILKSVHKDTAMKPELVKRTIYDIVNILDAFNLESGILGYDSEEASFSVDYLKRVPDKFSKYELHIELKMEADPQARTGKTKLSKPVLVRFMTNVLSNAARIGASEVEIVAQLTKDQFVVAVTDNGAGFPDTLDQVVQVHDHSIKVYQPEQGKTKWQGAVGTGTGLVGLKRMAENIDGNLIAGNRVVQESDEIGNTSEKILGGEVVIQAPVS